MDNDGLLMFIKVYDSGGLPHEEVYSFYKTDWFLLWFIDVYDMGWHKGKNHMKKFNIVWGLLMFMTLEKKHMKKCLALRMINV